MIEKYESFHKTFTASKEVLKDFSYKTLLKFMRIFSKEHSISRQDLESFTFNSEDNAIGLLFAKFYLFNENELLNQETEYINMLFIHLCVIGEEYAKSESHQAVERFLLKWLMLIQSAFDIRKILLNFRLYKKLLKFIVNRLNDEVYLSLLCKASNDQSNSTMNKAKINLFLIHYYNPSSSLNAKDNDYAYIDIFFNLKSIVQYSLSTSTVTSEQSSIINRFYHIFNNHFNALKATNQTQSQSGFISAFIDKLSHSPIEAYENFVYIFSSILTIENLTSYPQLLSVLKNILISNNSLLHKIGVNALQAISQIKTLSQPFLKKYFAVFDVLDGFNCHLFKSLHSELEAIVHLIDSKANQQQHEPLSISSTGFYFYKDVNSFEEFASIEMNFFLLLSRKIFNHCNSRIQKYLVKLISAVKFQSEMFNYYFTNDYFNVINNPLLYPENEAITYHNKVGVAIEEFYYAYLLKNCGLVNAFLRSLGGVITNRRIYAYLFNALLRVMLRRKEEAAKDLIEVSPEVMMTVIAQMKTYSYYNKTLFWKALCLLAQQMNRKNCDLIKVYYELISYVIDDTSMSLESLCFNDAANANSVLYKDTLGLLLNDFKVKAAFTSESKAAFVQMNKLQMYSNDAISFLYFSLWVVVEPKTIGSFFNANLKKLFSSYYPIDNKRELLQDLSIAIEVIRYYGSTHIDLSDETFNEFYHCIKSSCLSACDSQSISKHPETKESTFLNTSMILFDRILLAFMQITGKAIVPNDFLINLIPMNNAIASDESYMKYIKLVLFHLLSAIHFNLLNPSDYSSNKALSANLTSFYALLSSMKDPSQKVLHIETLSLCLLSHDSFHIPYDIATICLTDFLSYLDIVQDYGLYYCLEFYRIFFNKSASIEDFTAFIAKAVKVLTEKRENITYVNVVTFLSAVVSADKVASAHHQKAVIDLFNTLIDLNDNRTWLLLKIASELLMAIIKDRVDLIPVYEDIIIKLAISKETRGDDSSMLETSPIYLKSPFNIKTPKLIHQGREDYAIIAKYGLYIRYGVLEFFAQLIQEGNKPQYDVIVLSTLLNVIKQIDSLSGVKSEMQYTEKHRKKLRLAQFVLVLGSIFLKEDSQLLSSDVTKELIARIEPVVVSLFNKMNLFSVNFYLNLFYVYYGKVQPSFRKTLLGYLNNAKLKPQIVSPALIILSVMLIEKCIKGKEEIDIIIDAITIQCTSNICNIRGYAQFFIHKLNELHLISDAFLSHKFLQYLNSNENILRFFSKFNDKYNAMAYLVNHFSVEGIMRNNFDELLAEIIPIDIAKEFKLLCIETIPLENQDFSNPQSSWRYAFDYNAEDKKGIEGGKEDIDDFQKKYRPIEVDVYRNVKRKRLDVVVIASLIDKAPNLGGLARTCEVLNIGAITISTDEVVKDVAFLSAAASAERWIPLITIPPSAVKEFIVNYKRMGYAIVGLEQTQNSVPIKQFVFKEKCVIVLGNEKEGIPQELINLIDTCVIIPQYGEVRSLNVHVSAAIMLWELVNSIKK